MRVVVTGAGGFIGWHLVDLLTRLNHDVCAWIRRPLSDAWERAAATAAVEIQDLAAVRAALAGYAPDLVVHLAAQSLPGRSWDEPADTYAVNVIGTINLLEAARELTHRPRLLIAGSSAEYADTADDAKIPETGRVEPNSPYAASKAAVNEIALVYARRYDLDLVRFRPFYLAGTRKVGDVCSDFARGIVAVERGRDDALRVGSLDVVRDIIDVRDGVRAILAIAERADAGDLFNICGGRGFPIRHVLDLYRGMASVPVPVVVDNARVRPLEQKARVGDPARLQALGWTQMHAMEETLRWILEYWRAQEHRQS